MTPLANRNGMYAMIVRYVKIIGIALVLAGLARTAHAQSATETPALISLSPAAPASVPQDQLLPTPTRTPTPVGIALLEATEFANVRAEPSTESAQLGTIRKGETYNVIGRYVSWIQFEFPSSPTGKGWVFGELVTLSGNTDNIPEIDPYSTGEQLNQTQLNATATQGVITQTPGGILTATILARQVIPNAATATPEGTRAILPTFTYPPGMVAIAPTVGAVSTDALNATPRPTTTQSDGFPPILPIVGLGALGLLGLLISSLRK